MIVKITKLGASALMLILVLTACCGADSKGGEIVVNEGLKFNESTYPYNGGLLIANFGGSELNPLNGQGRGFISYYKAGELSTLIATDGILNAPKGMIESDGMLYICDVNKVVVYNLNDLASEPQIIKFGEGELFLNDIVRLGGDLFVSVTNTGNIFKINMDNPADLKASTPSLWCNVTGANGLLVSGDKMYVASYPADGKTTDDNVVYLIEDCVTPAPVKLIHKAGQYDGLALSGDSQWLYVSNWSPAEVVAINLSTKEIKPVVIETKLAGPADISIEGETLFVPDLVNSLVVIKDISK